MKLTTNLVIMLEIFLNDILRPLVKGIIAESLNELQLKLNSFASEMEMEETRKQGKKEGVVSEGSANSYSDEDNGETVESASTGEAMRGGKSRQEKQIIAEIIMTAGPRKEQDIGLGEDVCGLILKNDVCFFWIADGTSETPVLKDNRLTINFSSRTLAQQLGQSFRKLVLKNSEKISDKVNTKQAVMQDYLKSTLEDVEKEWSKTLKDIQIDSKDFLDKNLSEINSSQKDFSSTFTCGCLTTHGHLQMGCYGDSPFLVKTDNEIRIFKPENHRFFMRLNRDRQEYLFSTSNNHKTEYYEYENVSFLIAGSDGIGQIPDLVKSLIGTGKDKFSFAEIRHKIILFNPRTKDDKTLCILSLESF